MVPGCWLAKQWPGAPAEAARIVRPRLIQFLIFRGQMLNGKVIKHIVMACHRNVVCLE